MTAPVLSPAEQAETDRFGIHDEDVLADMELHADDEPMCVMGDQPAYARIIATCCGNTVLCCEPHLRAHVAWASVQLLLAAVMCPKCGKHFQFPTQVEDILREVSL